MSRIDQRVTAVLPAAGFVIRHVAQDDFAVDIEVWLNLTIHKLKGFKAEPLCRRGTTVKSNGFILWTSEEQKVEFKIYYRERSFGAAITDSETVTGRELFYLLNTRKVGGEVETFCLGCRAS